MRKILIAAAGFAALAGAAGIALAQSGGDAPGPNAARHGFFQADANNDGVVTRQEFDAGRTARFAAMDSNNDGQLTREEMRNGWREGRGHRGGRGGGHMLARADANDDGNITRDEFLARPIEHFNRLDANNDGVISTAERPQRRERGDDDGPRRGRGERPNLDSNNDGNISRAEFSAGGTAMFERMDANRDGRVTREEAEAARPGRGHHDRS